jgi:hypothetical protein
LDIEPRMRKFLKQTFCEAINIVQMHDVHEKFCAKN